MLNVDAQARKLLDVSYRGADVTRRRIKNMATLAPVPGSEPGPGGRLVIGDMQWATFSLASDDPERMARMCRAWEQHVATPDVPAQLPALLAETGGQLIDMCSTPEVSPLASFFSINSCA